MRLTRSPDGRSSARCASASLSCCPSSRCSTPATATSSFGCRGGQSASARAVACSRAIRWARRSSRWRCSICCSGWLRRQSAPRQAPGYLHSSTTSTSSALCSGPQRPTASWRRSTPLSASRCGMQRAGCTHPALCRQGSSSTPRTATGRTRSPMAPRACASSASSPCQRRSAAHRSARRAPRGGSSATSPLGASTATRPSLSWVCRSATAATSPAASEAHSDPQLAFSPVSLCCCRIRSACFCWRGVACCRR